MSRRKEAADGLVESDAPDYDQEVDGIARPEFSRRAGDAVVGCVQ
ncbi:MAG: hypothetical protein WCI20_03680 [bacterium]